MLVRCLLPIVAVLALLAGSVTAFAASGAIVTSTCCCPDPDTCRCHDHDGDKHPEPVMKRCNGDGKLVAPDLVTAIVPESVCLCEMRDAIEIEHATLPMPAPRSERPKTPPF